MKRLLLFIAVFIFCGSLRAQSFGESAIRERIHISTDKDNYLSGEIVWMKLITTDDTGKPLIFSKIGYIELVGEDGSHARERIEIREGIGEGTLVIPSTLPTGYYRLAGYTRWMRNESPEIFFEKRIGIVNPALAGVSRGSAPDEPPLSGSATVPAGDMKVTADRSVYPSRSEVRLEVSGIPADIHTLSVSVTATDLLGGFTRPALGAWKAALTAGASSAELPSSEAYEAEYEGAVITGKLVSTATGEQVRSSSPIPLISFPGNGINVFGGGIDETGRVVFRTARTSGFDEAVTTMRGDGTESWRIDLDDPFSQTELAHPLPTFPLEKIDREAMLRQSLAMQLQYSYVNDSLIRERRTTPQFFGRPDFSYRMEEWRRFGTMQEVMAEFVQRVQFTRFNQRWYLSVVNSDFDLSQTNSLVLLDGIPIIDHGIVYNYNPLLIARIDVYTGRYLFGSHTFLGIVALYTSTNSYPELQPDPFTQIISYVSPQNRRLFYVPSYSDEARLASRIPDYRHTLYWNADARVADGRADVNFYASDLTGSYQVLVEGITASGEAVSAVCSIEVR